MNHADMLNRSLHSRSLVIPILSALAAFGPLSIDMYLPSLPTLATIFDATPGQVQLTLSAFFIGFAFGQLLYGPLSDHYGRKPILLIGISLYGLTSLLCAMSPSIEAMIGLRFLQALGGGAGTVISRAIVRDLFPGDRAAQVLSTLMLVTAIAPLGAPLLGGYILYWSGWQMIFGGLGVFGLVCLAAVVWKLPESHPAAPHRSSGLTELIRPYGSILGHRQALGAIVAGGMAFAGMFAYIAGSPFVYIELFGVAPEHYGYLFALNVIGLMLGAWLNRRRVLEVGVETMLTRGTQVAALAGCCLFALAWLGIGGLWGIVAPLFVYITTLNLIAANAMTKALEYFPQHAGATAALFGLSQFGFGALATMLMGQFHHDSPIPMAVTIAATGVLSWSVWQVLSLSPSTIPVEYAHTTE